MERMEEALRGSGSTLPFETGCGGEVKEDEAGLTEEEVGERMGGGILFGSGEGRTVRIEDSEGVKW